jgi:zinc transport system substrate-binding protein
LFPETNHDPKLVAQIAEATAAKLGAPLDPEGAGFDPGPALYGDMMRGLASAIADCQNG